MGCQAGHLSVPSRNHIHTDGTTTAAQIYLKKYISGHVICMDCLQSCLFTGRPSCLVLSVLVKKLFRVLPERHLLTSFMGRADTWSDATRIGYKTCLHFRVFRYHVPNYTMSSVKIPKIRRKPYITWRHYIVALTLLVFSGCFFCFSSC